MESHSPTIALQDGLDVRQLMSTGSVLHIDDDYNEADEHTESEREQSTAVDVIGNPVKNFHEFEKILVAVDDEGLVKKKLINEGGGMPLNENYTVSFAFSGYWENTTEPFDVMTCSKPMVVDLKENGLLPGLQIALKSMLVGEMSAFLISYKIMYGELGVPPRIKPKADCVFYIKLVKSILTPKEGKLDLSEPNIFKRVHREALMLYSSGVTFHKSNNIQAAIQLFKKAVAMLHKCRLADEREEHIQEKLLIKLYINLSVCYNKVKQPLRTCVACNELHRLNSLWNNGKALFQNAKALRMIGEFGEAERRLKRAISLLPQSEHLENEVQLLQRIRESCNKNKLIMEHNRPHMELINSDFKVAVETLIKNFKDNPDLCKLKLPAGLNSTEMAYIKEVCIRENLFFNRIRKNSIQNNNDGEKYALDKDEDDNDNSSSENDSESYKEDSQLDS